MKWKMLSIFAVLMLTLMACQGADNAERGTDNPNIDPTTNRNTGDGITNTGDGITNNDRDYMLERDADRNQDRVRDDNGAGDNNRMNNDRDGETRYEVAEEAADKITNEIDEIDNAYVLTMQRNAYVAANLNAERDNGTENRNQNNRYGDDELTDEVKDKIGDIVRSVDENIENVYVSTNPDFLDLATNYADDMDSGRPIGGFFDQIGTMVDRLFPENVER